VTNARGVEIRAIAYGATLLSIRTPDRNGRLADIALGFDDLEAYLTRSRFFGAVVGRYGNRIANGRFTLDGHTFQLATNNGTNHLHGGTKGFDKVLWQARPFARDGNTAVAFSYTSADGEEGYPGRLDAAVSYILTERNELVVEYEATASKPTPINLTQHSYFNLAGEGRGDVLGHVLTIDADRYTPVHDDDPDWRAGPCRRTPFDFRQPTAIGADRCWRRAAPPRRRRSRYVLSGGLACGTPRASSTGDRRTLDVATTEPNCSSTPVTTCQRSAKTATHGARGACLETQHFPDSPNHQTSVTICGPVRHRSKTVFTFDGFVVGTAKRCPYTAMP
jgi:aldose 1-epimerase